MIDNTAMLTRDAQSCTCGHRNVSHAYGPVIDGSGIGNGPCGIDRDTRNATTGYLGDPCPCQAFEPMAPCDACGQPVPFASFTNATNGVYCSRECAA